MDPIIRHLGRADYLDTLRAMRDFTEERTAETPDEIWLVEHPPVYTQGLAGKPEHLLRTSSIPVVQTERGGQITYHGPGQIVAYTMIDLKRRNLTVRELVHRIENAVLATLATYNLAGERKSGAPGIYVNLGDELHKIASLGLRIRNHRSYHGVALNVDMNLAPFDDINPCGFPGLKTIDMAKLGATAGDHALVASVLAAELCKGLNLDCS